MICPSLTALFSQDLFFPGNAWLYLVDTVASLAFLLKIYIYADKKIFCGLRAGDAERYSLTH